MRHVAAVLPREASAASTVHARGVGKAGSAPPSDFAMLRSYVTQVEGTRRTAADFAQLRQALGARSGLGCSGREVSHLWCLLEGMLHLGNLRFTDAEGRAEQGEG